MSANQNLRKSLQIHSTNMRLRKRTYFVVIKNFMLIKYCAVLSLRDKANKTRKAVDILNYKKNVI